MKERANSLLGTNTVTNVFYDSGEEHTKKQCDVSASQSVCVCVCVSVPKNGNKII